MRHLKNSKPTMANRLAAPSLRPRPSDKEEAFDETRIPLTPLADLDLAVSLGWGDVPQDQLPPDWRTRKNPRARTFGW